MSVTWREATLAEVIELKRGYDLPQQDRRPGPVPLVSSSGVTDSHVVARVKGPGVVTGRYGTLGEVYYVTEDFWPLNTTLYVKDFKGNDPRFIGYFLRGLNFLSYSDKAAVPGLNRNHLHQAIVLYPPNVREQRAIAHILGTLDDKIELNRLMNGTLEALARALFKSWFVDFDPVRAKMAGRDPGLPKHLADLFPNRLNNCGKPEEWAIGTLAEVADFPKRSISPAEVSEDTPYIGLEHMPRRSIALTTWESARNVASNKSRFKRGEHLFGKLRPYFHKVGCAPVDGICSTDIVVVTPKAADWDGFTLFSLSSDEFIDYADQSSTGTKMPRTSWKTIAQYRTCLPSRQILCVFQSIVQPLIEQIIASVHEISTCAQTRDLLLPKLISGEIRTGEAERAVVAIA